MPISANVSRPKLSTTLTVPINVDIKTATISGTKINLPVVLTGVVSPTFTVASCATTNSSATVTSTANAFASVRVGDKVTGTGIAANTTVQSIASGNGSITLSAAATATGTVTLTFDPGTVDCTVYILSIDHAVSGTQLRITPNLYQFDGTQAKDAGSGYDNATISTPGNTLVNLSTVSIDLDGYLAKARKPRTDS